MILAFSAGLYGQDELEVKVDVLKDIQSPAANLLGIANTDIAKPNDPTAFMLNLSQATNNLMEIPVNYAVDLAPAWLLGAKKIDGDSYLEDEFGKNFWQTLVVSLAVNNADAQVDTTLMPNTAFAAGIKFSLCRGKVSDKTRNLLKKSLNKMRASNQERQAIIQRLKDDNEEWNKIQDRIFDENTSDAERETLGLYANVLLKSITEEAARIQQTNQAEFEKLANGMDFSRTGFKLDFNAALSYNFPNRIYSNGSLDRAAAWLTASGDIGKGWTLLAITRYLHNPDETLLGTMDTLMTEDLSLFNVGGKLQYEKDKFSLSGEYIFQKSLNDIEIESGYKFLINARYAIDKNLVLTLSFGRDFNNNFSQDGNVISALNFIKGFGSERKVKDDISEDFDF